MAWVVADWTFNGNGCNKATERQKQYKITKNAVRQEVTLCQSYETEIALKLLKKSLFCNWARLFNGMKNT